ncbi:hypothetical protein EIP91_006676 [Steccherinum ochraceum]|uniref:RRN7-type domain-containing protein n=1 Tax=Steccherinum ochraceum TaxID=92696 RepID=A0A4R0RV32_9APHY|nr:hypothetical protein EIP91_006676 [Steccherinum ochraceum]
MARRKCAVCGSKQWRKEPTSGLITCSEGHVLQGYRNESRDVDELGPHALRKRTIKSGKKKRERRSRADPNLYHGDRARYHYFQCQQLILRMQIQNLITLWHLPPEFETVCRDIWALHLNLLPTPPPPEPYLFRQDMAGGISRAQPTPSRHYRNRGDKDTVAEDDAEEETSPTKPTSVNHDVGRSGKAAAADSDPGEDEEDDDESSSSSSSSSSDSEDDEEMETLRREAEASPSSSSEDEDDGKAKGGDEGAAVLGALGVQKTAPPRKRKSYDAYDAPVSTIAVLMLGCWTLRIPVMYMDFVRVIESYDLVYLDPVRLLPAALVRHLTKHTTQALSPHFAPQPLQIHTLVSRLARLTLRKYRIFTPEMNVAPLLWRAVRAFEGTPALYTLVKKVAKVVDVPLTLHHSLAPPLSRSKAKDPFRHKFDSVPVEVSLACTTIVVLKLVYGLDGSARIPTARKDPAFALPEIAALLSRIQQVTEEENTSMQGVLSASSDLTALDLQGDQLDDYLDFCEKALLPRNDRIADPPTVKEFFPFQRGLARDHRDVHSDAPTYEALPAITPSSTQKDDDAHARRPGHAYAVYSSSDILGTVPEDYEVVIERAAKWTGVGEELIHTVVETLERRLARWWDPRIARERNPNPRVKTKSSTTSLKSNR